MPRQDPIRSLMTLMFRAHPWHGVDIGEEAPELVNAFIEITPTDSVKYELDKHTGLLKLDRPQQFSNFCPALYGLLPRTYCGERIGALTAERAGREDIIGDGDPLDICVLTEKPITQGNMLVRARPIGGLRMIDGNEADDKIIAVLHGDAAYGEMRELDECPSRLVDRLRHYFLTYKQEPDVTTPRCTLVESYDREGALEVIRLCREDYDERFSGLERLLG